MNVKKKQHYVWKHYLKPWSENGQIITKDWAPSIDPLDEEVIEDETKAETETETEESTEQPTNGSTEQPTNGSAEQPTNGSAEQPTNGSIE